jgi:hypothetical protein
MLSFRGPELEVCVKWLRRGGGFKTVMFVLLPCSYGTEPRQACKRSAMRMNVIELGAFQPLMEPLQIESGQKKKPMLGGNTLRDRRTRNCSQARKMERHTVISWKFKKRPWPVPTRFRGVRRNGVDERSSTRTRINYHL